MNPETSNIHALTLIVVDAGYGFMYAELVLVIWETLLPIRDTCNKNAQNITFHWYLCWIYSKIFIS